MNFAARRKPLALLFCYGFAGVLAGTHAADALAQASAPLRVDPVLLGLPPVTPAQAPAPAAAAVPAETPAAPEPARAEVKPIEQQPAVEARVDSDTPASDSDEELRKRSKSAKAAAKPAVQEPAKEEPAKAVQPQAKSQQAKPTVPSPAPAPAPAPSSAVVLPVAPVPETTRSEAPTSNTPSSERTNAKEAVAGSAASVQPQAARPVTSRASAPVPSVPSTPSAAGPVTSLAPLRVDPALLGQPPAPAMAATAPSASARVVATRSVAPAGDRAAPPLASQRVPYGPALDTRTGLASDSETLPPQVPAMGWRDEEEVPDVTPALALRSARKMEALSGSDPEPRPVFLSAQRMGGIVDREFVAEGDTQLRKIGTVLEADRTTYWPIDDEVEAEGRVHLEQGDDQMNGPKMRLKLQDQVGYFDQPSYTIKRQSPAKDDAAKERLAELAEKAGGDWLNSGFESPRTNVKPGQSRFYDSTKKTRSATEGRGDADRLDFEGKNQFRLTNASYTTCKPDNDDWYAKASEIKLDYDREVGDAKDATVYFKDVPILYSPWLSFSLNNQRKSGFLAPSFGTSTDSGIEIAVPYYWNIAPNMDATITPRAMSKRGVMVNNEVRYLNTAFGGLYRDQLRLEYLPNDNLHDGKNRYGFSLQHTQSTDNGFSARINYNKVSDDNYYTDLSSGISSTSTTQLSQQGLFSYHGGGWWNASANFQQYQTLQPDPENPVREPYRMLPQLTLNARKPDWLGTDSSFLGQFTRFTRPDQVIKGTNYDGDSGQRTVLYPQVAIPFVTPGWYVTPKLGVNIRHYNLSGQAAGTPSSINTTLPIASIDSGMFFERQSNWFGRDYTQTLEPRLYYLNIPFKDQSDIPRFDTELADFNFAQMFSENQFTSWDRINSANQLTAAVTTRLLEPQTGNEIMRATLGQRIYFSPNRVGLDSTFNKTDKWDRSDILAAFSGQVLPKVYADAAWQYNLADRQVKRYSMGAHYRPEPGKVLNATYRYNRDASAPVDQIDLSAQWPLSGRWYAVGRLNYSFKDDKTDLNNTRQGGRMIESIAGLEYNAGCWAIRGVIKRTALTEDKASSSFFIQLELTDFGQIGSNPLNLLKRNIQGYSPINASESDADLGD